MNSFKLPVRPKLRGTYLKNASPIHYVSTIYWWFIHTYLLIVLAVSANAQPAMDKFEHLSVKNGLSNNSVNCILQDREGFMWFGTNDGLNKYDGYTFRAFQPDPSHPTRSFRNNRIMGMCEGRGTQLWVVTEGGGLHEVNKQTGEVIPHPIQGRHDNWWDNQLSVYEDHQGMLWLSTYGGLVRYDASKHHFTLYPSPQREIPIKCVFEDRQNRFWVATLKGLYQFDRQTGRFTLLPFQKASDSQPWFDSFYLDDRDVLWLGVVGRGIFQLNLRSKTRQLVPYKPKNHINKFIYVNTLHQDQQGFIWIGTTEGLQRINPGTNQVFTYLPNPNTLHSLSSANAQTVYHDRTGTLWVGTDNGIDKQAINNKPFVTYQIKSNIGVANLPENKVSVLSADNQGRIWFGNQDNLYRLDSHTNRITEVPSIQFGTSVQHKNYLFALLPDGPDNMWIGTWDCLYHFDQKTNRSVKFPTEIHPQFVKRDSTDALWLAGENGIASFIPRTNRFTYYRYNPADTSALPNKFVYGLLISRTGDIWAPIRGKGISRLNRQTGQFTRYMAGNKAGQLNNNEIGTLYEDPTGIIWLGTTEGGLNWFDPKTNLFSHVTTRDGLPSNWITGIISDNTGNLWLSTNKGLCRFNPHTKIARHYDINDGLPSNDFIVNAVYKHGGSIFFGTLNGLVRFNPDSIRDDTLPFPVYIKSFKVMNKIRSLPETTITLRYNENFLSFEFVALTYGLAERTRYAYQLEGIDPDWVQNSSIRFANYTNLPPGNYTFRVKASNNDGPWNYLDRNISIHILSPWWQSWLAYLFFALVLLGSVWGTIAYRSRQLRLANRRLEETVNNRTAEVRRQSEQISHQRDNLEKTLTELTATQRQLIHREKMASLGELTAGIAHEIQNPLNFVNNFSEVSMELTNEIIYELSEGNNQQEVIELVGTLQQNLSKITHHGKRADAIIKNMLQHAHSSNGQKQFTDLNKLTDEHLRLAYQGLRAKDKTLQVELISNFDPTLVSVLVVPQDIGRVLLNLFSNAFYSLTEKQKQADSSYQPTLTVSSRQSESMVELCIHDNGLGISPVVLDKIYQPFFTTKPTGQGTGLGLSISYDIVTKGHGGELFVKTQKDQFAEFVIKLPTTATS